ncbi:MAG: type 2 isopentenyl-diphosphate Delta-isomerase [Thermoactinomyces sp.]
MKQNTQKRKNEHLRIVLNENVTSSKITTGLENYRFVHQALPEVDLKEINLSSSFLGKPLKAPLFISSMTGGTEETGEINKRLAAAAQECGWAMALGSMRVVLEYPEIKHTFQVRRYAPDIPILANIGAVQLNKGVGSDECRYLVEIAEADALVLHLNPMQEVFQPEGDVDFKGLLNKIETLCVRLSIPVGVKEVGWGINAELVKTLFDCGVQFVDVAGAGGTLWSQVEKHRTSHPLLGKAAQAFTEWGIPTAECILEARSIAPTGTILASGGLETGIDAAKALALGADLAGFGRALLPAAISSDPEEMIRRLELVMLEMKLAMFGAGIVSVSDLKESDRLVYDASKQAGRFGTCTCD